MIIFRHLIEALVNPYFLVLLLLTLLVLLLWLRGASFLIRCGFLFVLLLLLVLSSGWFVEPLTRSLESQYSPVTQVDPSVRWIVVLSGGQAQLSNLPTNDLLYGVSMQRLIEGLRLYRQLPLAQFVLSGGGYGFEIAEANHLAELASWFQIPSSKIVLESKSVNTEEQSKAIRQIVKDSPFYLVTSASHMRRSMQLCQRYGLHPIPAPTDFTHYWYDEHWPIRYMPNAHNLFYLSVVMHEYLGLAWLNLRSIFERSRV